jgi:hypothetical protein
MSDTNFLLLMILTVLAFRNGPERERGYSLGSPVKPPMPLLKKVLWAVPFVGFATLVALILVR